MENYWVAVLRLPTLLFPVYGRRRREKPHRRGRFGDDAPVHSDCLSPRRVRKQPREHRRRVSFLAYPHRRQSDWDRGVGCGGGGGGGDGGDEDDNGETFTAERDSHASNGSDTHLLVPFPTPCTNVYMTCEPAAHV